MQSDRRLFRLPVKLFGLITIFLACFFLLNNDCFACGDFSFLSNAKIFATNNFSEYENMFSQNDITFYDPNDNLCLDNALGIGGQLVATGDFAKIMTAKNAEKSFFNGSGDVPSARWGDGNEAQMKQLLETYGDLAYQLGNAVGAPYIAILVQMRYEDPDSVCGRNNFWGNGCDSAHAYAGGATIQGNNLGEGFVQYGKTLTNGYYDGAIGIADPIKYLETIGPMWVQGDPNGPGYGSIDGMRKSVKALQDYIATPEGQAIVQTFGNYHGAASLDGSEITWIGDSYSVGAQNIIKQDFPNVDFGPGTVNTASSYIQGSKYAYQAEPDSGNPPCLTILKDVISQNKLRPYLVLACGTNGSWSDEAISELDSLIGSRSTNVVLTTSKTANVSANYYDESNNRLKTYASAHDNVVVADWAAAYNASYFESDKIHPTSNGGYNKWVEIIKGALNSFTGYSSSQDCICGSSTGSGKTTSAVWQDGWLVDNSIPGVKREDVNNKSDLNESPNAMGSYTTNGKPNKILLHSTEGQQNGYAAYPAGNKFPAHFTIDVKKREAYQAWSIYQPATAIASYDLSAGVQIEIVGFSVGHDDLPYALKNFSDEDWDYLVTLLRAISEETGIPLTTSVEWSGSVQRLSGSAFENYEGILGHMHAPGNDHTDPGNIWPYVEAAIERSGGYNKSCNYGNGNVNAVALELAWPMSERNNHAYDDPTPAYRQALADTGVNKLGDSCSMVGGSCDAFVTTVMRKSGADPDFKCCGVSNQYDYIVSSNKYVKVENKLGSLKPGDIRIKNGQHIEMYVEINGEPYIASASHCDRTGDIGNFYDNSLDYEAWRLK